MGTVHTACQVCYDKQACYCGEHRPGSSPSAQRRSDSLDIVESQSSLVKEVFYLKTGETQILRSLSRTGRLRRMHPQKEIGEENGDVVEELGKCTEGNWEAEHDPVDVPAPPIPRIRREVRMSSQPRVRLRRRPRREPTVELRPPVVPIPLCLLRRVPVSSLDDVPSMLGSGLNAQRPVEVVMPRAEVEVEPQDSASDVDDHSRKRVSGLEFQESDFPDERWLLATTIQQADPFFEGLALSDVRGDVLGLLCSANYNRRESAARDVSPRQLPGAAVGSLMDGQRAALVFSDGSFTPCFLKLGQSLTTLAVEGTHIKSRLLLLNNVLSVLPSPDMRAVLVLKTEQPITLLFESPTQCASFVACLAMLVGVYNTDASI